MRGKYLVNVSRCDGGMAGGYCNLMKVGDNVDRRV